MKQTYEKPQTELYLLQLEGALLNNSVQDVESMTTVEGSWQ